MRHDIESILRYFAGISRHYFYSHHRILVDLVVTLYISPLSTRYSFNVNAGEPAKDDVNIGINYSTTLLFASGKLYNKNINFFSNIFKARQTCCTGIQPKE